MTSYAGFIPESARGISDTTYLVDELVQFDDAQMYYWPPAAAVSASGAFSGSFASALPVERASSSLSGARAAAYSDDYYYRVRVVPPLLDLQSISADITAQFEVWNAQMTARTLTDLLVSGGAGLAVDTPAPPLLFGGLESHIYTLSVALDGPALIDARFDYRFGAESALLTVIGSRLLVMGFAPDWASGIEERLEYLTAVARARDGSESRTQLRSLPRRSWRYRILAVGDEARELEELLWHWQGQAFGVPVWRDPVRIDAAAALGALLIACTTAQREFVVGGYALLWRGPLENEVVKIDAVSAGGIDLTDGLKATWPAGTLLYPLRIARVAQQVDLERPAADVVTATLEFELSEPSAPVAAGTAAQTYGGAELWLREPNRAAPVAVGYRRERLRLDGKTGLWREVAREPRPAISRQHQWVGVGRSDARALLAFVARMAGRSGAFVAPTWQIDLQLASAIAALDTHVAVRSDQYNARLDGAVGRNTIALLHRPTGAWIIRTIISANADGLGQQLLELNSAVGQSGPVGDWRLYWLEKLRFDRDELLFTWRTPEVVTFDAPLLRVDA